jgi:XTP/dITP diphosphohydrolase
MVAALPDGTFIWTDGTCEGLIAKEPRGSQGFGYDPVFYLPDRDRTMAEISKEEKNAISHRGKAMRRLKEKLKDLLRADAGN